MKITNPIFVGMLAMAIVPIAHAANLSTTTAVNLGLGGQSAAVRTETKEGAKPEERGNQEIDRRITALTKLEARIADMNRVSQTVKANLQATVNSEISALTALKAKLATDTDAATLKADLQSITKSYRIFMVVIPQGAITAAADHITTAADLMTTFGTKLQTRIAAAASAGQTVTTLQSTFSDYTAKLADAKVQASAALSLIANIKPDNGVQSVIDSNKQALLDAHTKIKAGQADLKTARADAATIIKTLKGFNASTNAHVNVDTNTQ